MIDFKLPEVGENISSGQAVKISVQKGSVVKKDQTLLNLKLKKPPLRSLLLRMERSSIS